MGSLSNLLQQQAAAAGVSGGTVKYAIVNRSTAVMVGIGGGGLISYNEVSDPHGLWDDSNKRFVIPIGTVGTVHGIIHASFFMSSNFATSDGRISIHKNGSPTPEKQGMFATEGNPLTASFPIEGVAGDYWEVWFETSNGGTHELGANASINWARFDLYSE